MEDLDNREDCGDAGDEHDWPDEWERGVEVRDDGTREPTGDRARECQRCGRWEIQWAEGEK